MVLPSSSGVSALRMTPEGPPKKSELPASMALQAELDAMAPPSMEGQGTSSLKASRRTLGAASGRQVPSTSE